jgi:threonine dehydrogenase-like Zn-dependent dehydrogenase
VSALAAAAVAAAASGPLPVEVAGSGELAAAIRAELGLSTVASEERPGTIVETTGAVAEIQAALARVRDLGTVVLAVAPAPEAPDLDLYVDLHARGLTVVGVPEPPG